MSNNIVRFSKNSLITNSTKDNTGSLRDQKPEDSDFLKLHKNLMSKNKESNAIDEVT